MRTDHDDRRADAASPSLTGAPHAANSGEPLLQVRGLVKRYGGTHALRGVDFATERGEIHALVGENGAGKSTLTRILTGATRADAGEIRIDGRPCAIRDPLDGQRLGLRTVHQHDTLVPHLSITENILLGRLPRARPVAGSTGAPPGRAPGRWSRKSASPTCPSTAAPATCRPHNGRSPRSRRPWRSRRAC